MLKPFLTFVLIILSTFIIAQTNIKIKGRILNSITGDPVSEAHIYIKSSEKGTTSDSFGKYSIEIQENDTLIYTHILYDSVHYVIHQSNMDFTIYFEPAEYVLPDAVVKPITKISTGMMLDVTDYYFVGDSILYSGFCYRYKRKNNPWIIMISPSGDTVFTSCVGEEGYFYKDCLNYIHYITEETAYQLRIENKKLFYDSPTEIDTFWSVMKGCEFESSGKVLFNQYVANDQMLFYYLIDTSTSTANVWRTITNESNLNALSNQSFFLSMGNNHADEHDLRFEKMMYKPVFAPVFKTEQNIIIVNYTDSNFELYDIDFNQIKLTEIYFHKSKYCIHEIIVDDVTGKLYSVFRRNGKTSLREICSETGEVKKEISIPEFYWIENIKAHNDQIYFLYREKNSSDLRALYKMFID